MHMLSLGISANAQEKNCRMTFSIARKSMIRWWGMIHRYYELEYLRQLTHHDIVIHMTVNQDRGLHDMFGNNECMH